MPKDLTMWDVRRAKQEALGPLEPKYVRMSSETLRILEDSYRNWLIDEAKRKDAGLERDLIKLYKEEGFTSWEDKQRKELSKVHYVKGGDKIYGLIIIVDEKMEKDKFKIEYGESV